MLFFFSSPAVALADYFSIHFNLKTRRNACELRFLGFVSHFLSPVHDFIIIVIYDIISHLSEGNN